MDLDELYQHILLDHSKRPRNFGPMENATSTASGDNPSCGDEVTVWLRLSADGSTVEEAKFSGSGCAISQASASLLTIQIKGKSVAAAAALLRDFQILATGADGQEPEHPEVMGNLRVFAGVRKFPQRAKCATLACHAMGNALEIGRGKESA